MRFKTNLITTFVFMLLFTSVAVAETQQDMADQQEGILSLTTATPEEGFQLAIALSRRGVTDTQADKEVLKKLRPAYSHDPDSLIAASQVVAIHFQTIAAANNYWRNQGCAER